MQRDLSYGKGVCLSVTRVKCDKTNESSADIIIPHERKIHPVFRHEEWLMGDVPFYVNVWAKLTRQLQKQDKNNDLQSDIRS